MKKLFHLLLLTCCFSGFAQNIGIIPQPQSVTMNTGDFVWNSEALLLLNSTDDAAHFAIEQLRESTQQQAGFANQWLVGEKPRKSRSVIRCEIVETLPATIATNVDQAYILDITPHEIRLSATTSTGLFYGIQSLKQLFNQHVSQQTATIPCMTIIDFPTLKYRGWLDDISRGPIVSVDYLKQVITTMANYKINFFNLYTEHVFKLESHPDIAPQDGLTAAEVRDLEQFAKQYHIEMIGNQQCFAHAEKMLSNPFYDHLSDTKSNLNPANEATYRFLEEQFAEVATAYQSPLFNINCDETEALGSGKAKAYVDEVGATTAYYRHINRVYDLLKPYGKRVMMWGDIAVKHPEIIKNLPKDLLVIAWSYVDADDFTDMIVPFKNSGFEFMIAPGVSMWSTIFPDINNYVPNIAHFVRDGYQNGALGMMNTAWDDAGESLFNSAWHGMIWGAEMAWKPIENQARKAADEERTLRESTFNANLNRQFFNAHNCDVVEALYALNRCSQLPIGNMMQFEALSESLTDFYPPKLDSTAQANNQLILTEAQRVEQLIINAKTHATTNLDILDNALYAARRLQLTARRNLLRIALYQQLTQPDEANEQEIKTTIAALLVDLHALKNEYLVLWERENRPYWRDVNMQKYNQLANELLQLDQHVFIQTSLSNEGKPVVSLQTLFPNARIYYTLDGSLPKNTSNNYTQPFTLQQSCVVKTIAEVNGKKPVVCERYLLSHKGMGHLKQVNTRYNTYRPEYSAGGDNGLLDGIVGSNDYKDGCWQGYQGVNIDIEVDFAEINEVHSVSGRFLQNSYDWILSPEKVLIYSSLDGTNYQLEETVTLTPNWQKSGNIINTFSTKTLQLRTRYLRVVVENPGPLPEWHPSKGHPSYLFMDEIVIE